MRIPESGALRKSLCRRADVLTWLAVALLLALLPGPVLGAQDSDAALTQAEHAAAGGDMAEVRRVLTAAFGAEVATLAAAPPPRASQALLDVTTTAGERTYELRLLPAADATAPALLDKAAAALERVTAVTLADDRLTVRLPFSDTAGLLDTQAQLRAALPDAPELALFAAALSPAALEWQAEPLALADSVTYRETVNLEPAKAACEARAATLETASAAPATDRLAQVQAKLWAADAASWRAFCTRSRATYHVRLDAQRPARRWDVPAGASRPLAAEARIWHGDRLTWLAAALALLIILFVAVVWRASAGPTKQTPENAEYTE